MQKQIIFWLENTPEQRRPHPFVDSFLVAAEAAEATKSQGPEPKMFAIWSICIMTVGPICDFVEPLTKKHSQKGVQIVNGHGLMHIQQKYRPFVRQCLRLNRAEISYTCQKTKECVLPQLYPFITLDGDHKKKHTKLDGVPNTSSSPNNTCTERF